MREYGVDNWEIILVKKFTCTRIERFKFEERLINMLFPSLNKIAAYRSYDQKLQQSREHSKKYYRQNKIKKADYYQQNKDKKIGVSKTVPPK